MAVPNRNRMSSGTLDVRPTRVELALCSPGPQARRVFLFRHGRVMETWWGVLATFATSLVGRCTGAWQPPATAHLLLRHRSPPGTVERTRELPHGRRAGLAWAHRALNGNLAEDIQGPADPEQLRDWLRGFGSGVTSASLQDPP